MRNKLESLQVLRFIAAWIVVALHITQVNQRITGHGALFEIGNSGVDIFFVISGFIMAYTFRGKTASSFAIQRIARIVPLYWLLTGAVFVGALVQPSLFLHTTANLGGLLKSLLFIPYQKAPGMPQPMLFQGWTLNYEMFFYAIFACCIKYTRKPVVSAAAILIALTVIGYMAGYSSIYFRFYTDPILLEFTYGLLLYGLYQSGLLTSRFTWTLMLIGGSLLLVQFDRPDLGGALRAYTRGIPAFLIVAGFLGWKLPHFPMRNVFIHLGDCSYSTYLGHPFIIGIVAAAFMPAIGLPAATALIAVGTIIVSDITYRLVEKPANESLRRVLTEIGSRFQRSKRSQESTAA
jgi:peptidoglycan/LPS O-acetylase OafA/YrhL